MPKKQGDIPDLGDVREARERFAEHLPPKGDLELLVLKGHLLVEEALYKLVAREIRYPQALEEANFKFFQILHIAKGLCYAEDMKWLWDALARLNRLRNQMAHDLNPDQFRRRLNEFLEPHSEASQVSDPTDLDARLREMLETVHLLLHSYSNRMFDHGNQPNFHEDRLPPNKRPRKRPRT